MRKIFTPLVLVVLAIMGTTIWPGRRPSRPALPASERQALRDALWDVNVGELKKKARDSADVPGKPEGVSAEQNLITFSKIDKAWEFANGKGTRIAVLDWCFDMSSKAAAKYINPTSLVPGQPVGGQEVAHGEWMAEIIHTIAPEAKIIPVRTRPAPLPNDDRPSGPPAYEKYLIKGIRFAADQGAAAVTSSMGPVVITPELSAAIDYAEQRGTIFVDVHPEYVEYSKLRQQECAADECDKRIIHTGAVSVPAHSAYPEANRDVYVWPYPIAPGYQDGWGYSNCPPIVAGVIALMKSANPSLTPQGIRDIIKQTAYARDGFRVLDAEAAVRAAKKSMTVVGPMGPG